MTLNQLPPEVLSVVTKCLSGLVINALWCTGDVALQGLLANGGATHYTAQWQDFEVEPVFPSILLAQLRHLVVFELHLPLESRAVPVKNFIVDALPSTITRLICQSTTIDFSARNAPTSAPTAIIPMARRFPCLVSFEGMTKSAAVWEPGPVNLTSLVLYCPNLAGLTAFPPNLTELSLRTNGAVVCPLYPPSLTILKLNFALDEYQLTFVDHLPPHLQQLFIHSLEECDLLDRLPKTLEVLHILSVSSLPPSDLSSLPRNLRILRLGDRQCYGPSAILTQSSMIHLPPRLTSLELPTALGAMGNLPPTLTHLRALDSSTVIFPRPPSQIQLLPSSLLHLCLGEVHSLDVQDWNRLPPNLTILHLKTCQPHLTFKVKMLPRSLASLKLPQVFISELAELPPALTSLKLKFSKNGPLNSCVSLLPHKFLTKLHLKWLMMDDPVENEVVWPPVLKELKFSSGRLPRSAIALLPASLRKLSLVDNAFMDSTMFVLLPRRLRSLTIVGMSTAKAEDISHLPRTLCKLSMRGTVLIGDCKPYMPKLLKPAVHFRMRNGGNGQYLQD